ncbi:MAG: hypothetical protein KJ018_04145, partial [Burkholderiales bacterium]|nr:hypothetical protein [Burkholderiales bacterium]
DLPWDQWRRIRGEQEIVVRYEPDKALATLPALLADPDDRERLATLVRTLLADERVQRTRASAEQLAMIEHIGEALAAAPVAARAKPARRARRGTASAPRRAAAGKRA